MNKNDIAKEFNNITVQCLDFVYNETKNKDISFYRKIISSLNKADVSKIIEQFIIYCYEYKTYVLEKNIDFFINTNFNNEKKDVLSNKCLLQIMNIKELIKKANNESIDHVFQYLIVLFSLSDNYLKQSNLLKQTI
tara:strand:- start:822 stop:1229 length:408 start_codon:yes stop_codon:yes gene_type:complete